MKRNKSDDPSLIFFSIFLVCSFRQMFSVLRGNFEHLITRILLTDTWSKSTLPPKSLHENLLKKDLFSGNEISA